MVVNKAVGLVDLGGHECCYGSQQRLDRTDT